MVTLPVPLTLPRELSEGLRFTPKRCALLCARAVTASQAREWSRAERPDQGKTKGHELTDNDHRTERQPAIGKPHPRAAKQGRLSCRSLSMLDLLAVRRVFSPAFNPSGHAVSFHGFLRILQRSETEVEVMSVEMHATLPVSRQTSACTPGQPDNRTTQRVKVFSDNRGEYLKFSPDKRYPKWRPWNGEPVPYRLMTAKTWPG